MKKTCFSHLLLLAVILSACQYLPARETLDGSAWTLSQINSQPLVSGSHIELQFNRDTFSGFGGCNSYGGNYQISGDRFTIIEGIESTAMACITPEGVGEQEGEYFSALKSAMNFTVSSNRLEMKDDQDNLVLVFIHQKAEASFGLQPVLVSQWQVQTIEGRELIPGSQITMKFAKPGLVEGFGGCRSYQAEYIENDQRVGFTSVRMGEGDCGQEDLLIQEQDFTDYLTWSDHFELVGENLILFTQRGEEMVFIPFEE